MQDMQHIANATEEQDARTIVIGGGPHDAELINAITESETQSRVEVMESEPQQAGGRDRLYSDEEWRRDGNNKKWRDPSKEKQRKKMAKASKRINRRNKK